MMSNGYPRPHYDWLQRCDPSWRTAVNRGKEIIERVNRSPLETAIALAGEQQMIGGGDFDDCLEAELQSMLSYWKFGEQVFCLPRIVQEKFNATDVKKVGLSELARMPYSTFYVNLRECPWGVAGPDGGRFPVSGFYVTRTYSTPSTEISLRTRKDGTSPLEVYFGEPKPDSDYGKLLFFIHAEGHNGDFGSRSFFNIGLECCFSEFSSVGDYVTNLCASESQTPDELKHLDHSGDIYITLYRVFAALLMYLNTENPDVRVCRGNEDTRRDLQRKIKATKKPKKARRLRTLLGRLPQSKVRYVGESIEKELVSQPGFSWDQPRHWRRGHDHHYWSGPLLYPKGHELCGTQIPFEQWNTATFPNGHEKEGERIRTLVMRWNPPTLCNPDREGQEGTREYWFSGAHRTRHESLRRLFREGAAREVTLTQYERDPDARAACLEYYGYVCQVCDHEPAKDHKLGELVAECVQVHHKTPLHEIKKEYVVDPINDLVPVCYECHKYIHSRGTKKSPYSVEELRMMIDKLTSAESRAQSA